VDFEPDTGDPFPTFEPISQMSDVLHQKNAMQHQDYFKQYKQKFRLNLDLLLV
jgi:hypothetical protein